MAGSRPLLIALAVTYRRPEVLLATLQRVSEQTVAPDLVVVVDNDPSESAQLEAQLSEIVPGPVYVPAKSNLGPAGGIALGVDRIEELVGQRDYRLVLIDDDDPPVRDDSIERLSQLLDNMQETDSTTVGVGLIGGRVIGKVLPKLENLAVKSGGSGIMSVDWVNGGYLPIYQRRAIERTAGFRPELFFGYEELDFGLHLKELGLSLYVDQSLWNDHVGGYTKAAQRSGPRALGDRLDPSWRTYWTTRNLHWVLRRYGYARSAWYYSMRRVLGRVSARKPRASLRAVRDVVRAIRDGSRAVLRRPDEARPS